MHHRSLVSATDVRLCSGCQPWEDSPRRSSKQFRILFASRDKIPLTRSVPSVDTEHLKLEDLSNMTRLRSLILTNNGISALPSRFFRGWTNMERLWLNYNDILTLPIQSVGDMANTLKELYLDNNRLKALPSELARLTQLLVLTLNNNNMAELPPQLGTLTQIKRLEVGSQNGFLKLVYLPLICSSRLFVLSPSLSLS